MSFLTINFLKNKEKHTFHLVDNSQLPLITSTAAMLLVMSIVFYFHPFDLSLLYDFADDSVFQSSWSLFSGILFSWFILVLLESGQGYHTWTVRIGLRVGMVLFIVSEIMFFFAFFWAFFHVSLAPAIAVGGIWPPISIQSLDVWGLPLVNTFLLLSSGVTITFAHHAILNTMNLNYFDSFAKHLGSTVLLGAIFLFCQALEYEYGIIFRWKESVYGSTFFVTTGFHGFHVSIGTIFLLFCLIRGLLSSPRANAFSEIILYLAPASQDFWYWFSKVFGTKVVIDKMSTGKIRTLVQNFLSAFSFRKNQHLGFESAAWYWHFVDVVWIFLFITVYWWGS